MITPSQQRLLDLCEDGEMESLVLVEQYGTSNKSVLALLRELERNGYVEILRHERKTNFHELPRRKRTVFVFRLTAEGLAQHAPPPGWEAPA